MEQEESDFVAIATNGQIVVPLRFRKLLKITPGAELTIQRLLGKGAFLGPE